LEFGIFIFSQASNLLFSLMTLAAAAGVISCQPVVMKEQGTLFCPMLLTWKFGK
jgi:hypothetical protein